MLEEIKHLFDNTGIVFVLGMNRKALLPAVQSVYGATFNASDYLHRFVKRVYNLPEPSLEGLVQRRLLVNGADISRITLFEDEGATLENKIALFSQYIASAIRFNGRTARDIDQIIEYLLSFTAFWPYSTPIQLGYLLPLIMRHHYVDYVPDTTFTMRYRKDDGSLQPITSASLLKQFETRESMRLSESMSRGQHWNSAEAHISNMFRSEALENMAASGTNNIDHLGNKLSLISKYRGRVNRLADLTLKVSVID
jgi:hypothetical protein